MYVLLGTVLLTVAILLLTFAARVAAVIKTLLDGTPGIPFRQGSARNASATQIRLVGFVAVLIAGVFFFQAGVRFTNGAPLDAYAPGAPGIAVVIGSAVLATSQLTIGLLSIFERRASEDGQDHVAVRPRNFVVFGCGCLVLLIPSIFIFIASV